MVILDPCCHSAKCRIEEAFYKHRIISQSLNGAMSVDVTFTSAFSFSTPTPLGAREEVLRSEKCHFLRKDKV